MVGGYSDVSRPVGEEGQHRGQDTADGCHLEAVPVAVRRHSEEMAKQLVGAIDKVNFDGDTLAGPAPGSVWGIAPDRVF